MSIKEKTTMPRHDTSYGIDHWDYIKSQVSKRRISFAQVVRELLDIAIPLHKKIFGKRK